MPEGDIVTRREFEEVRLQVRALSSEQTAIAVLGQQMSTLNRDLSELKSGITKRFDDHDAVHRQDQADRVSGRRWLIGTAIAGLAAMAGLYGWMALLLHK